MYPARVVFEPKLSWRYNRECWFNFRLPADEENRIYKGGKIFTFWDISIAYVHCLTCHFDIV